MHQVNTVNALVLTVTVFLTFALVAAGAPANASAQYLGNVGDSNPCGFTTPCTSNPNTQRKGNVVVNDPCGLTVTEALKKCPSKSVIGIPPPPPVEYSAVPFIILSIMGVATGAIASAFFIKGRSGRHAAVGK